MKEKIKVLTELKKEIGEIIGFHIPINTNIDYLPDEKYNINDGFLRVLVEDASDYYEYIISSYGEKGKEFFVGEKDDLVFVLCYRDEEFTEDAEIIILSKDNEISYDIIENI